MIVNFLEETNIFRGIIGLIRFVKVSKSRITFWQKDDDGNRKMFYGYIDRINLDRKTLTFKVQEGSSFDVKDLHIYVHGDEKSLLLKGTAQASDSLHLMMSIPQSVRYLNKRYNQRFRLSEQLENRHPHEEIGSGTKSFTLRIHDISLDGISFQMHPHHLKNIELKMSLPFLNLVELNWKNQLK